MFKRRIGRDPHADNAVCASTAGCPDIWELASGDFAVIGCDMTGKLSSALPPPICRGTNPIFFHYRSASVQHAVATPVIAQVDSDGVTHVRLGGCC